MKPVEDAVPSDADGSESGHQPPQHVPQLGPAPTPTSSSAAKENATCSTTSPKAVKPFLQTLGRRPRVAEKEIKAKNAALSTLFADFSG